MLLLKILVILLTKLITPTYQDAPVTTVLVTNHLKKPLLNVVTLQIVVVLPGAVGVPPKETTWSTSGINSELENKLLLNQLQEKSHG
jgi:hypothetical protein